MQVKGASLGAANHTPHPGRPGARNRRSPRRCTAERSRTWQPCCEPGCLLRRHRAASQSRCSSAARLSAHSSSRLRCCTRPVPEVTRTAARRLQQPHPVSDSNSASVLSPYFTCGSLRALGADVRVRPCLQAFGSSVDSCRSNFVRPGKNRLRLLFWTMASRAEG